MRSYPRGLPVLVRRPDAGARGVIVGEPDDDGEVLVALSVGIVGEPLWSFRPLADLTPDLSEPQARSWAREEVARRLGLDVTGGVEMSRDRGAWRGWWLSAQGMALLSETAWSEQTLGPSVALAVVPGIDTDDEAAALSAALAHLEER